MLEGRWVVVVPVKDAARGKTRLADVLEPGARAALVRAMALDTLGAVLAARSVARLVVVTGDAEVRTEVRGWARTRVVDEPVATDGVDDAGPWAALDRAVRAGVGAARSEAPGAAVAVLLGDLPALDPEELDVALGAASALPRAVLADAQGTGTTLLTAGPGEPVEPQFGAGSAAAHAALGHTALQVDVPTLRHDIDLPADLAELVAAGTGGRTGALLRRLGPLPRVP